MDASKLKAFSKALIFVICWLWYLGDPDLWSTGAGAQSGIHHVGTQRSQHPKSFGAAGMGGRQLSDKLNEDDRSVKLCALFLVSLQLAQPFLLDSKRNSTPAALGASYVCICCSFW